MDDPELTALRQMIAQAADMCTDTDLLDLIYRLLTIEITTKEQKGRSL